MALLQGKDFDGPSLGKKISEEVPGIISLETIPPPLINDFDASSPGKYFDASFSREKILTALLLEKRISEEVPGTIFFPLPPSLMIDSLVLM